MAYKKTNWQDTLRDAQGNVIQKGTPLNAQALGKIEEGIVQTEQKIDTEIGKVTTQLAQKVEQVDVSNAVAPKADKTYVDTALSSKLDKTGTISVGQIDKNKGKFDQTYMTDEFLQQIAGTTPVNSVPADKSITSIKFADESVTASTLNQEYNFRGIQAGIDVNTLTKSGIYFLTAASPNTPVATSMMIYTQRYGSRFVQIARRFDNPTISWVRGGDVSNIANLTWRTDIGINTIATDHILPKAITSSLLADSSISNNHLISGYDYNGFFSGSAENVNTMTKSGLYYLASSVSNLPKRNYFGTEAVSVIMKVERYNTRVLQIARPINQPHEVYYRYTDSSFEGVKWIFLQRENKPLYGKKVILMGDSLTDKGKQHLTIWANTGADVDKIGIGGTTMSNHGNSAEYSKLSFYALAKAISTGVFTDQETAVAAIYTATNGVTDLNTWLSKFKAIDWNTINYILVRYGTNDHAMDNPIGAINRTNFDISTYLGAFNQGVKDILTAYPHIRIFVATPLWRYSSNIGSGGDSDVTPNKNGAYLIDFVDALGKMAGVNHLPFHDYYRESGINSYTDTHYLSDQTHLSDAGSLLIGQIDSNFLISH